MIKVVIALVSCLLLSTFISCKNPSSDKRKKEFTEEKVTNTKKGSPVGTWTGTEDGKPMQFVFNADGSGYENYRGEEKREFTWVMKDDGPYITYSGDTNEWQIQGYDEKNGTITYGSLVYKRE